MWCYGNGASYLRPAGNIQTVITEGSAYVKVSSGKTYTITANVPLGQFEVYYSSVINDTSPNYVDT